MNKARKTALFALAAGLAACSDSVVAPRSEASDAAAVVNGGGSMQSLTGSDTVKFAITIDPSRQTYYYLGEGNSLTFPAHSLCDPSKSSYGSGEWDKPCVQATLPVTVQVKAWLDSYGHARVDFSTHLRFVPSNNPAQWVSLTFADLQASLDPHFDILYCQATAGSCTDEAKKDATLMTVHNPITGKITRRIKHFSGYNVAAGDDGGDGRGMDASSSYSAITSAADRAQFSVASSQLSGIHRLAMMPAFRRSEVDMLLSRVVFARRFSGYMLASG
ncbi:MAG: hypothetical protein ABJF01_01840 [bacterium]